KGTDYSGYSHGQHHGAAVHGAASVEDGDAAKHGAVGHAIERGVVECAEHGGSAGTASHGAVEHVEERGEPENPPGGANVAGGVDHAADHGAHGADGRDGVGIDPAPHHEVGHRL